MNKTTIAIDDLKISQASSILGTKTKTATVDAALEEVIRHSKLERLAKSTRAERHIDPEVLAQAREKAWS